MSNFSRPSTKSGLSILMLKELAEGGVTSQARRTTGLVRIGTRSDFSDSTVRRVLKELVEDNLAAEEKGRNGQISYRLTETGEKLLDNIEENRG